jgi:hypothetical protein
MMAGIREPVSLPHVIGFSKLWHLSGGNRRRTVFVPVLAKIQRHSLAEPNCATGVQRGMRDIGILSLFPQKAGDLAMNQIIYLIGLVVVIMAILSFLGLR